MQRCSPKPTVHRGDLSEEAAVFRALGDPVRLAIVATLARSEKAVCVCDFTSGLTVGQPTISHHLKVLKEAGLVTSVRRGTWGHYSLTPQARARIEGALAAVVPVRKAA